jgi:N-carbamoyl-L-amino-acid hydrolase
MDARLRAELAESAAALGIAARAMPSGGGHDAAAFADAGVPAAMLFVRNQNGSHTPEEAMRIEDFSDACALLGDWMRRAAG